MDEPLTNNWRKYARAMEEAELACPNCPAMNRPGALLVRIDDKGVAGCDQCGHVWTVDLNQKDIR